LEREQVIALLLLYRRLKKRRAKRLHWVHPINQKRKECGDFCVVDSYFEVINNYTQYYFYITEYFLFDCIKSILLINKKSYKVILSQKRVLKLSLNTKIK